MRRALLPLVLLAACGAPVIPGGKGPAGGDAGDDTGGGAGEGGGSGGGDLPSAPGPWLRDRVRSPGPVAFNELQYHPPEGAGGEWIELHNPLVFDLDLTGWRLDEGVDFAFPAGTRIPAGGFLVVAADPAALAAAEGPGDALGPWQGSLSNRGERVVLRSNGGRRIDSLGFDDGAPWPISPDGSGATLAKLHPDLASDTAEHWSGSGVVGGTPGADNGLDPDPPAVRLSLVGEGALWAVDTAGGTPDAGWAEPGYDDSAWELGFAPFRVGEAAPDQAATLAFTADNHHAVYLGAADGGGMRFVGTDSDGSWTTVEEHGVDVAAGEHLYVAAWELSGDSGSPQMLIGEVDLPDGSFGTHEDEWEWVLGPAGDNPGFVPGAAPPAAADLADLAAGAEADGTWAAPMAAAAAGASPWGGTLGGVLPLGRYLWADTFGGNSVTNVDDTYALFRTVAPLLGPASNLDLDEIPVSVRFRTRFSFAGDPARARLRLSCALDDGAAVYLNGVEVHRENLPAGALSADTLARAAVDEAAALDVEIDAAALVAGDNLLAVSLHQAAEDDADLAMDCTLVARVRPAVPGPGVWLDEVPGAGGVDGVELRNAGADPVELGDLRLWTSTGEERGAGAGTLDPGQRVWIDGLALDLAEGDRLFLGSAGGDRVHDAARIAAMDRARDAAGAWRTPAGPTPGEANAIELEDAVVINEIHYHAPPVSEPGVPFAEREEEWIELFNRSDADVDLSGWRLEDGVAFEVPDGTVLAAGGYLVLARDAAAMRAAHPDLDVVGDWRGRLGDGGDRVLLRDALGNPADEVAYADGGRWPAAADGGGSSLELRDPWADNAAPAAWAASDESGRAPWTDVVIRGVAEPSAVGPDGRWEELVLGLLDAGEVLVDDISVVQDPDTAPVELVADGGFDGGGAGWRWLGTHRHGGVVPDPDDPADRVLRIVATGATGHMHNHVGTTLAAPIEARTYEISFRARWVSGSNQLHSRLYFNRLPATTLLPQPEGAGTPGRENGALADDIGPTGAGLRTDPVVPEPGEPFTVSVSLSDPDGVADATLFTAVDGGAFTQTPMDDAGDGTFSATLPGQPAGTLVQFYVSATDGAGAVAQVPAAGADSRALVRVDAGDGPRTGLHDLRILMTPADAAWLHQDVNLMSDDRLGATVVYDGAQVFHDVGVRLKGSQRGRPTQPRVGYALRFPDDQPFRGSHSSVMIDRSEGVGFGQREVLHNIVMTRAGSPTGEFNDLVHITAPLPEASGPAELQLDRFSGLVLDAQFEEGSAGMRYEYELVYYPLTTADGTPEGDKLPQPDRVVGTPITDLGPDKEAWRHVFLVKNNERRDDFSDLMEMGAVFAAADEDFLERAPDVIDVDQWLRAFAMSTVSGATDQYGGVGSQHNVQFYVRPTDGRILQLPHDLDFYGNTQFPLVGNADLARLLADPDHERAYYAHLEDLLSTAYSTDFLSPWCDQLGALLPDQDFDGHCAFVADRAAWIRTGAPDALETRFPPTAFRITTNGGDDLEVDAAEVALEGRGWVDVRGISVGGAVLEPAWLDDATWRISVPLAEGDNDLLLQALDLHGDVVGQDEIRVVRTGG